MRTSSKLLSLGALLAYTGVAVMISMPQDAKAFAYTSETAQPAAEYQSYTVPANTADIPITRDAFTVYSAAQVRQAYVIEHPGAITSKLQQTKSSTRIHDPQDGTVFFPLTAWNFDYAINGYHTEGRPEHAGTDFQADAGTEMFSIAAGTVTEVGSGGEFGNFCVIEHVIGGKKVTSTYAHQIEAPLVKVGDAVEALELIGHVGSTGKSTGPHLHLVVTVDGVEQDPAAWLEVNALR